LGLLNVFTFETIVVGTIEHLRATLQLANLKFRGLCRDFLGTHTLHRGAKIDILQGVRLCDGTTIGTTENIPIGIPLGDEEAQCLVGWNDLTRGGVSTLLDVPKFARIPLGLLGVLVRSERDTSTLFETLGTRVVVHLFHRTVDYRLNIFWYDIISYQYIGGVLFRFKKKKKALQCFLPKAL
jgi:hypothetical protein